MEAEGQEGIEFGDVAREGYMLRSPNSIYGNSAVMQLQLAELLGDDGQEFLTWTVDALRAWARHGYNPETNIARLMWADGTDLTDHVIQRTGYYGQKGRVIRAGQAGSILLWSYVLGYRLSGDESLWETARGIARGHGLGHLGTTPGQGMELDLKTGNSDPVALYSQPPPTNPTAQAATTTETGEP